MSTMPSAPGAVSVHSRERLLSESDTTMTDAGTNRGEKAMNDQGTGVSVGAGPEWLAVLRCGEGWVLRPLKSTLLCCDLDHLVIQVERLVEAGGRHFVINLSAVDDIDGACVGGLVRSYRIVRESGGSLRLSGVHPWVRKLIDLSGVSRFVPVDDQIHDPLPPTGETGVHLFAVSRCA